MAVACTSARVVEGSPVRQHVSVNRSGDPVGWLDVGEDGELSVYGSPGALRRLAAALLITADEADALRNGASLRGVSGS
jgi:hypothetical protein